MRCGYTWQRTREWMKPHDGGGVTVSPRGRRQGGLALGFTALAQKSTSFVQNESPPLGRLHAMRTTTGAGMMHTRYSP